MDAQLVNELVKNAGALIAAVAATYAAISSQLNHRQIKKAAKHREQNQKAVIAAVNGTKNGIPSHAKAKPHTHISRH